jgi:SAM-dependent methyltransferase
MSPDQNERYTVGYTDDAVDFFQHRRAATHAGFFLAHLRSGMSLLECGCGPGTITADLAEIVAPGRVVGVDIERSQIDLARAHAENRELPNLSFEVANIYQLPFSDGSFDAVFLHGVLEHLKAPQAALAEVRRVLKVGGVVGMRNGDWGGFLFAPTVPCLAHFFELLEKLIVHNGGNPHSGRDQLAELRAAGFDRIQASASYDCWTPTREATRAIASRLANYCSSPDLIAQVTTMGLADRSTIEKISAAFTQWGEHPGAFAAEAWGEAIAWKD